MTTLLAGTPLTHLSLYHRCCFICGDPAAYVTLEDGHTIFIVRDIEKPRAIKQARADEVLNPQELTPSGGGGLSGDRETATAQAAAECLVRRNVKCVQVDRSLPYVFAAVCQERGIQVVYNEDLGVLDRRAKQPHEIEAIAEAQRVTERAIELACRMIARAERGSGGQLKAGGAPLTVKRVKRAVADFFAEEGYSQHHGLIVAPFPDCADCHAPGSLDAVLRADKPVIVDIFPMNDTTRYHGDCTRTVVNGTLGSELTVMHAAVVSAKAAAEKACKPGVTGEQVHQAAVKVIEAAGFSVPRVAPDDLPRAPAMPHGTGHGLGLVIHEPILLAYGVDTPILEGEVFTIEPGLYATGIGGVRVEDAVVVQEDGVRNLNTLHEAECSVSGGVQDYGSMFGEFLMRPSEDIRSAIC